ncbi:MAG: VOC family protein [Solirubrobacterales bacterium]|nr:VOC family protein [Solirubrobacterales bacterium]
MLRFDHIGTVVDDLNAAEDFFVALGFERAGEMEVSGEAVDCINGLSGVRAEIVMLRAPDGGANLELSKYHAPVFGEREIPAPANRPGYRHICLEVDDLDARLSDVRARGFDTVGDVCEYGGAYRLCYVRGPEGLIVELGERVA